jgi:hypothetical protein
MPINKGAAAMEKKGYNGGSGLWLEASWWRWLKLLAGRQSSNRAGHQKSSYQISGHTNHTKLTQCDAGPDLLFIRCAVPFILLFSSVIAYIPFKHPNFLLRSPTFVTPPQHNHVYRSSHHNSPLLRPNHYRQPR